LDVSVILLTRNTCQQTLEAIGSVFSSTDTLTKEIHVIDNGSTDDTAAVLPAAFPEIHYKRLGRNVGFARGVNLAAREASGEFFLLLNSDARLAPDAMELAVEWMRADTVSPARNCFAPTERDRTRSPTSLLWRQSY
jgi:N-acetylglucosaminyl-diphospho-decaprenol L-rhamnosyltransferase